MPSLDPGVDITQKDQQEVLELYRKLLQAEAKLVGPDGKSELLPNNVNAFFYRLLGELREGKSVTILQNKAELTTVEASKLLGMSRQFLVELLKKKEIPFHMVGTHRRLYARDVLAYKIKREIDRRRVLDEMARREYESGTYYLAPNDTDAGQ